MDLELLIANNERKIRMPTILPQSTESYVSSRAISPNHVNYLNKLSVKPNTAAFLASSREVHFCKESGPEELMADIGRS